VKLELTIEELKDLMAWILPEGGSAVLDPEPPTGGTTSSSDPELAKCPFCRHTFANLHGVEVHIARRRSAGDDHEAGDK
jgi:hypothetical protein